MSDDELLLTWGGPSRRLDRALRESFPQWARKDIDATISSRRVRVNSRVVWLGSWQVERGDRIVVHQPPLDKPVFTAAFDASWVIADTGSFVVVNKPAGLRSEATRSTDVSPNLLAIVRNGLGDQSLVLAHRLDRDTSGLLVLTRPGPIRASLDALFKNHQMRKRYVAIVQGPNRLEQKGSIRTFLAADPSRKDCVVATSIPETFVTRKGAVVADTSYEVVANWGEAMRVNLWPHTGRQHQLRVQCQFMGAPIVGDTLYGSGIASGARLMLHAEQLDFTVENHRYTYECPAEF